MVFEYAPATFYRVVLAVVGRIVRELQTDAGLRNKLNEPRKELRPPAVTFGTIIQIEQERLDLWKAFFVGLPPLAKNIAKAVTGDFGGHRIDRQCVITRQEYPNRCHHCGRMEVMVCRLHRDAVLASTRVVADLDRRFCVYREAENGIVFVGVRVYFTQ